MEYVESTLDELFTTAVYQNLALRRKMKLVDQVLISCCKNLTLGLGLILLKRVSHVTSHKYQNEPLICYSSLFISLFYLTLTHKQCPKY